MDPLDVLAVIGFAAGAGAFGATAVALRNRSDGPRIAQGDPAHASAAPAEEAPAEEASESARERAEGSAEDEGEATA
jgi:hypothetical protein